VNLHFRPGALRFVASGCSHLDRLPTVHSSQALALQNREPFMIDRICFAALSLAVTLTLLSAAISTGRDVWQIVRGQTVQAMPTVVQLPRVEVVGRRQAASAPLARADEVQPALRAVQ